MEDILAYFKNFIFVLPEMSLTSVLEIVIIAVLVYELLNWIMNTRAWTLLKGIGVILVFIFFVYVLKLETILWLLEKGSTIVVIMLVIIFQPELRRALEHIGSQQFINMLGISGGRTDSKSMTEDTCRQIVNAVYSMAPVKTGALIVIEQNEALDEWIDTGIIINGRVGSGLLINIFEKNTPLHDGAVIIRGNEVVAATCYLPLSDNQSISKALGTRHRAALGISEKTDSITIVVSEETGRVSVATQGRLDPIPGREALEARLIGGLDSYRRVRRESRKKKS